MNEKNSTPEKKDEKSSEVQSSEKKQAHATAYWKANLRIMTVLLSIWFVVSFVAGIIAVDALNNIRLGGFKLGFWFAQQGSIYVFVILIFVYVKMMNDLDKKFGFDD